VGFLDKAGFMGRLIAAKAFRKNVPLTVIFNITDKCNLKCAYCYANYYERRKDDLPFERVTAILDEVAAMGCKRVSFGGGEPLLRPDIGKIVDEVKKRGMECAINSNGYFVPDKIEVLKRVDALCLSLDGDEAAHAARGPGSFQKVMEAIVCASRHGIPIHTNTVLHKGNLHAIEFVLELARKYDFLAEFNVAIDHITPTGKPSEHKSGDEDIKEALRKLIRYKKQGHNILFSEKAMALTLAWPAYATEAYYHTSPAFKHPPCYAGKYFCFVDTNGDVYPCPHLIGRVKPVNAASSGFKTAFKGLDGHHCRACYQVYHNEFNSLFDLDPAVILNYARISLAGIFRRRRA
jgi:MoaA/NifB/PqqE/SkfB family radical SAM enzyme